MFREILRTQWQWTRGSALIAFLFGFAIPIFSLQAVRNRGPGYGALNLVRDMQQYGRLYAALAAGVGLAFAILAWSHDQRGRHVYALALPVSRARYAGMRYFAGGAFLVVPALGVLLGCAIGLTMTRVPTGLRSYPLSLTLRFVLASGVAYSIFFAISSASFKASAIAFGGLVVVLVTLVILTWFGAGGGMPSGIINSVFADYGLLSVFTGRWMLIDA